MENKQVRRTRSGKLLGSVVTKKTVREIVEVVVTPFDSSSKEDNSKKNQDELQVISISTKENEKVEVFNSSKPQKSPLKRVNIDFGDKTEEDQAMKEEGESRKKKQWRKEEQDNEIEKQQTRDYMKDSENKQAQDKPEKKGMDMEDEEETQPASEADVPPPPPPPPLETMMLEEENDEWYDVETGEQKDPSPSPSPSPQEVPEEAEEEEEEELMEVDEERGVAEKAKQAEEEIGEQEELSTPPRHESPQKKVEETDIKIKASEKKVEETNKKKRKASAGGPRKGGVRKKRSRGRGGDIAADYKTYIYRVLKQVHPDLGISSKGMAIINSFLNGMYEKIADEAAKLLSYTGGKTLSVRDMQDAVKMVLPGELGKHAMAEGMKAVNRYTIHTHKEAVVHT